MCFHQSATSNIVGCPLDTCRVVLANRTRKFYRETTGKILAPTLNLDQLIRLCRDGEILCLPHAHGSALLAFGLPCYQVAIEASDGASSRAR